MSAALRCLVLCLALPGAAAAEAPARPRSGDTGVIAVQRGQAITGTEGASATVFSAPLQRVSVQVISAMQLRPAGSYPPEVSVSVQDLARDPGHLRAQLGQAAQGDHLLLNGGFSTDQPGRPAGLLVTDGRVLSIPNYVRVKGQPKHPCSFLRKERFRLSALLCVPRDGPPALRDFSGAALQDCEHAIQAGPMLIQSDAVAVCRPAPREAAYRRTALCITAGEPAQREFKVIVTDHPVSLHALAQWMKTPAAAGGLGCDTAMNLGGDDSSGAALFTRRRWAQAVGAALTAGQGSYPQASFVAVSLK